MPSAILDPRDEQTKPSGLMEQRGRQTIIKWVAGTQRQLSKEGGGA
jgi:hypothetical protein